MSGPFPPWQPSGPDGTGPPHIPDDLRAWWHHTGGRGTWVTTREPKARHGRDEVRLLWALADPYLSREAGRHGVHRASWPHLQQVCRIERRRTVHAHGRTTHEVEVSYGITSLPPERADARTLLAYFRGHWGIENKLHYVRDVTFDEDRSQTRTGAAPHLMAAIRNLALALLRRAGHTGGPLGDRCRPAHLCRPCPPSRRSHPLSLTALMK